MQAELAVSMYVVHTCITDQLSNDRIKITKQQRWYHGKNCVRLHTIEQKVHCKRACTFIWTTFHFTFVFVCMCEWFFSANSESTFFFNSALLCVCFFFSTKPSLFQRFSMQFFFSSLNRWLQWFHDFGCYCCCSLVTKLQTESMHNKIAHWNLW